MPEYFIFSLLFLYLQKKLEYQISGVKGNTEDSFSKTPDQKVFGSAGEMNKDMTQCVTKKEGNLAKETDHEIEKHERANMLRVSLVFHVYLEYFSLVTY